MRRRGTPLRLWLQSPFLPITASLLPTFILKFTECILCSRNCSACTDRSRHLSLMSLGSPMKMKESVTVSAQISTYVAQDDSCSFSIIMVVTHRLKQGIFTCHITFARTSQMLIQMECNLFTTITLLFWSLLGKFRIWTLNRIMASVLKYKSP